MRRSAKTTNTLWPPVVAAGGILLLLIWFALSQAPADDEAGGSADGPQAAASEGSAAGEFVAIVGPDGVPATAVPPAPVPASGCEAGTQLPAGRVDLTIKVGTIDRLYHLAVPEITDPAAPLPLIFNFHGFGQSAGDLEAYTGLVVYAMSQGYAVVTPTGFEGRWNFVQQPTVGPNDVAFVEATLNDLVARGCLDPARVYAVGYGDGGDMAATVGCALPGRFAAVATVASSTFPTNCDNPPPGLLEIHGTADPVAPYDAVGPPRPAPLYGVQSQPVEQRLEAVAARLGCSGPPTDRGTFRALRVASWNCPAGHDVGVTRVEGGGHTWLGA
nr:PHB depolymerase family esterase [Micromonospora sp. DSM 115978]